MHIFFVDFVDGFPHVCTTVEGNTTEFVGEKRPIGPITAVTFCIARMYELIIKKSLVSTCSHVECYEMISVGAI